MKYLLDTNVCIDVLRGRKKVIERLTAQRPKDCALSAITEFELLQGARRAPAAYQEDEHRKVLVFLAPFHIHPFDSGCADIAANLNAKLLDKGKPISITDVFIAACALHHGFTLITNNTRDFRNIPELQLEDWR